MSPSSDRCLPLSLSILTAYFWKLRFCPGNPSAIKMHFSTAILAILAVASAKVALAAAVQAGGVYDGAWFEHSAQVNDYLRISEADVCIYPRGTCATTDHTRCPNGLQAMFKKNGSPPKPNGCGPKHLHHLPASGKFRDCCNVHDICFGEKLSLTS